jgi:hypothetical protein
VANTEHTQGLTVDQQKELVAGADAALLQRHGIAQLILTPCEEQLLAVDWHCRLFADPHFHVQTATEPQ